MIKPETVLEVVADASGASVRMIVGTSRLMSITYARHVAMYMIRTHLALSYPEIGILFGDRDHTTVISAVKRIQKLRDEDPQTGSFCDNVEKTLGVGATAPTVTKLPSTRLIHIPISSIRAALALPFGQGSVVVTEVRLDSTVVGSMKVSLFRDKETLAMDLEEA